MTRHCKSGIHKIQKQQSQLIKMEKILKMLLIEVNESMNALKIEELQLKCDIISKFESNLEKKINSPVETDSCNIQDVWRVVSPAQTNSDVINAQYINLNLLPVSPQE